VPVPVPVLELVQVLGQAQQPLGKPESEAAIQPVNLFCGFTAWVIGVLAGKLRWGAQVPGVGKQERRRR
jgi:hypothetical protein